MQFRDRIQAGKLLAQKLKKYKGQDVVVYALPRGGVVTAAEIAHSLHTPLDIIITRKIGHPYQPEYAVAAINENGDIVGDVKELSGMNTDWLKTEIAKEKEEATRRRIVYIGKRKPLVAKGKIAILVDDGVATGWTLRAGIKVLQKQHPQKIVVAVPVIPRQTSNILEKEVDEVVALDTPPEDMFLGSVGAYYDYFPQVSDEEVIDLLTNYKTKNIYIQNS